MLWCWRQSDSVCPNNPDAGTEKALYLDLFKDPEGEMGEDEAEFGVTYGFHFLGTPRRNDHRQHWFKLGRILDYPHREHMLSLPSGTTREWPYAPLLEVWCCGNIRSGIVRRASVAEDSAGCRAIRRYIQGENGSSGVRRDQRACNTDDDAPPSALLPRAHKRIDALLEEEANVDDRLWKGLDAAPSRSGREPGGAGGRDTVVRQSERRRGDRDLFGGCLRLRSDEPFEARRPGRRRKAGACSRYSSCRHTS